MNCPACQAPFSACIVLESRPRDSRSIRRRRRCDRCGHRWATIEMEINFKYGKNNVSDLALVDMAYIDQLEIGLAQLSSILQAIRTDRSYE